MSSYTILAAYDAMKGRSMLTRKLNAAVFSALSLTANAATAHHSVVANFDREDVQEVSGTITEVHIRNPHSQYVLEVAGEDGAVVEWFIEWADKNALTRRGVDLDRIKVGDEISVTLWPSHRLENVGYFWPTARSSAIVGFSNFAGPW